jgi:hypothetical protein
MASHGTTDNANNIPLWAVAKINQTPNTSNRAALFGNTTAIGVFHVDSAEATAQQGKLAHSGIVMRTVGTGGRAGRILTEVLVASGSVVGDSENTAFSQLSILINTQPQTKTVNTNTATTLSVVASAVPTGTVTYQWQANTGAGFANLANAGVYSGVTTGTVAISNTAGLTGNSFRALLFATGAANAVTSNATLTVV